MRDIDYFKRPDVSASIKNAAAKYIKPEPPPIPDPEVKARQRAYMRDYMRARYKKAARMVGNHEILPNERFN